MMSAKYGMPSEGRPYLGAAIEAQEFTASHVCGQADKGAGYSTCSNNRNNTCSCYLYSWLLIQVHEPSGISDPLCEREVEHASFILLVLSATGGLANQASVLYKRLASSLAMKWEQPYRLTMSWLRNKLTFSLLCSAIHCIRRACFVWILCFLLFFSFIQKLPHVFPFYQVAISFIT